MTGSSLVAIIVPIVALIALAAWLGMVFWADAHPGWKAHAAAPGLEATAAVVAPAAPAAAVIPARRTRLAARHARLWLVVLPGPRRLPAGYRGGADPDPERVLHGAGPRVQATVAQTLDLGFLIDHLCAASDRNAPS
jgi:hypothetical protein